jgi:hypothetical protein
MSVPAAPVAPVPSAPGPCLYVDPPSLRQALTEQLGAGRLDELRASRPHLFSDSMVLVATHDLARMRAVIGAIERVVNHPGYRAQVLAAAPDTARHDPRIPAVFMGYDFHLGPGGPRLIEINTNAGGALLNVALLRAHLACCPPLGDLLPGARPEAIESAFVDMFRHAWRAARGDAPLARLAIVDDDPDHQFLHPEFVLFEELFRRHGLAAEIADAAALTVGGDRLQADGRALDLVYNRVTDFAFAEAGHAALRRAWLEDLAVITPHPHAHALYADKHNLALLTDPAWLAAIGVDADTIATLRAGIARTTRVDPQHTDTLWAERKRLFFKPVSGFGGKAVYRGDKLTRRVWEEILAGDYVAQELVQPPEQTVSIDEAEQALKYDVRNFVYQGEVQLLAARLYQGQTTNFRTPGGGFAPVFCSPQVGGSQERTAGRAF